MRDKQFSVSTPRLWAEVYLELHALATQLLRHHQRTSPLHATSLLHETYLRLARNGRGYDNRAHFLSTAARAMRYVLVDQARHRQALKRLPVPLESSTDPQAMPDSNLALLTVHELLHELSDLDPRKAQVVELRFFGGLDVEEVAGVLGCSQATVKRDWTFSRAWLRRRLRSPTSPGHG